MQLLIEAVASLTGQDLTKPFPIVRPRNNVIYAGLQLTFWVQKPTKPGSTVQPLTYGQMVQSLEGIGDFLVQSSKYYEKRFVAIQIEGEVVGEMVWDYSYEGVQPPCAEATEAQMDSTTF